MTKTQKWLIILTPVTLGLGYIIYQMIKGGKTSLPSSYPLQGLPTNRKVVVPAAPTSDFPLKVGSKNKSVMALQDELGVTIDGIFGPKTLAALKEQVNLSSISDASQLQSVLDQIDSQDAQTDYDAATNALLNTYNNNTGLKYLNIKKDSNWFQLNQASDGSFSLSNTQFFVPNGNQNDISQVFPDVEDMPTGKLIILDNRNNAGIYWLADPTNIYLS